MKIGQAVASTLLVAVTEAIQDGKVTQYGTYEFPDNWESQTLDALGDDFTKSLLKALDGSTLEAFLRDQLRHIQVESKAVLPKQEEAIVKLRCFSDPLKSARKIIGTLETIPVQYRMIVRIFQELSERIDRDDIKIALSDRLTILSGKQIPSSFKLKHDNSDVDRLIRGPQFPNEMSFGESDKSLYMEFRTSGYLSNRRTSRAVGEFFDEVRAFYGACLATKIMSSMPHLGEEVAPILISDKISGSDESFAYVERAEDDIVRCANLSTSLDTDRAIKAGKSIEDILNPIYSVFKASSTVKLKTACAWAPRAHLSTRGLDKILESAITIEVLMGDRDTSDRVGLSKLIANRCAYALGRSSKERDETVEFFVKFYKVRSEVVHSGRTSLQPDERKIVDQGINLATRILKHEIALAN